ncbi:MAG: hypothetical protein RLZZ453_759 [Chlamydiota bacterium]|jgi:tetratricopeptide (TPR) repeat protein
MKTAMGCIVLTLLAFPLASKEVTTSLNERVALKKLSEYLEEKDEDMAEAAITDFIASCPKSAFCDQLYAILGDLHFSKKRYPQAIDAYSRIEEKEYKRKTAFRYLHSLYEAGHFEEFCQKADFFLKDPHAHKEELRIILLELGDVSYSQGLQSQEEKKPELFRKALSCYQLLGNSSLEKQVLQPLAELYTFFEEYPQAVKAYQKLSQLEPSREEELLFHVASLQLLFDKDEAVHTFDRVFQLQGPLSKKAGYNVISLLFQQKRYSNVIAASIYIKEHVPEDKLVSVRYYIGKSLFYEKDFEGAIDILEELFLSGKTGDLEEQITSTLLLCAQERQDLSLCDKILKGLDASHPLFASALSIHAELSKANKEWKIAKEDMLQLLKTYPNRKENATLCYELSTLLMQEGQMEEAIDSFSAFIAEYPSHPRRFDALRNLLYLRSLQAKNGEGLDLFTALLSEALQQKELFSEAEQKEYRLFLAQGLIRQGRIEEAQGVLEELAKDHKIAAAHLLLAHCIQGKDDEKYSHHLEQALVLDFSLSQDPKWHILLFNAYLRMSLFPQAAEHLFLVPAHLSSLNNQRWLANYYEKQGNLSQRVVQVLERIVAHFQITVDTEVDAVRLATLYKQSKEYEKGITLLKTVVGVQKALSHLDWKYHRMAQFELGSLYALIGQHDRAIDIYQELISTASHVSSYFALAAKLELAKLKTEQLASFSKEEEREETMRLCDLLKEVEVKRQLESEPLHTEAALCYIDLKTKLVDPALQQEKKSMLLSQVKQELQNFCWDKSAIENKREIIDQYLAYIDIQLSWLKKEIPAAKAKEELLNLMTHVYNQTLYNRLDKSVEEYGR